ncbi:MAG: hypothetical protein ACPGTU_12825 [Myxococcota bacterium]
MSTAEPTPPESVNMKRVFVQAALLTAVFAVVWSFLGVETPGYTSEEPAPALNSVANTPAEQDVQTIMNRGIALLHEKNDAKGALAHFDEVLSINAGHYGAQYQRAKAFDVARDLENALNAWRDFLPEAERSRDPESAEWARSRVLHLSGQVSKLSAVMEEGVNLLHGSQQPDAAITRFNTVLSAWPSHYGASYQVAVAYEQAGQLEAAKEAWGLVLSNARAIGETNDTKAAADALARLNGE